MTSVVTRTGKTMGGIRLMDYSASPRVPVLLDMVAALSRAREPSEVLVEFSKRWIGMNAPAGGYVSLSTRDLAPGEYRITRLLNEDNLNDISRDDTWTSPQKPPVHRGGLLGSIVEDGVPVVIQHMELRDDPVVGSALADYRSMMALPLFDDGKALNWSIQLKREPDAFTVTELEDTLLRSNLVGGTVRHVQTAKQLREAQATMRREVDKIAEIQKALLPQELPKIPGVSISTSYETFDQAGGDMYFFHELGTDRVTGAGDPDGWWGMFIADVSGHGPSAAVVMAMVESILASVPFSQQMNPGEILMYLNRHLSSKRIANAFVTAFIAGFDPSSGELKYARAGHPPPLLRRCCEVGQEMTIDSLDAVGGLPLGIRFEEKYDYAADRFNPGDTLALYTDGITEARSPDGRFFATDGVIQALRDCNGQAYCLVDTLKKQLLEHEAGQRPQDDQTLVALHRDL